ncbi:large conductance mechanosensitive channel protein MscL [Granulicatella sp. zg-ZJ]|uniref:large conductance mechanosensitive channel protein MscL n=1 Tax=unclassified Granulicatella TaxID=2630493 RepID=UPI0013C1C8D5|nr:MULTISPECIES: large conductance mechanosensitive channel protein MscL [unclassified Granulicatella]MBS4749990.1 large conductance mechanosensitive channel protein MscL [Carnobacteriaceae bacterium zg-ZUI78]NEW63086.1 large conductance mechanosensitive channel protein MscL [Granulicatella sp. zg-ZJ]NEW66188.1 large conductance mechanosensitive channel protein MscL [Granulicatella sp. zg-84]QMI86055.1 large conductance mechanosensitive channel protein MscL [Carnobacteriaceae bacterium zg-84]
MLKDTLKELKSFLLRGNIVDLAVAVIIGGAFGAIVKSLVEDIFTPIIAMIFGQPSFESIMLGTIRVGNFINAVINFVLIGTVLFFTLKAIETASSLRKKAEAEVTEETPAAPTSEELLTEIRDLLKSK